ncbi:hypothetical protein [Dongia sp.]|uniref:hypothetical protein n=1 Tax=Dongia sp. TaxID=1977262 RepID=UPI0035AE772B
MSRASRERKLMSLEAEYSEFLTAALERCAAGKWGLLDQNDRATESLGQFARHHLQSPDANHLLNLGAEIEQMRSQLGYADSFPLHARLLQMRTIKDPNAPGEPRLAQEWLDDIRAAENVRS